MIQNMRERLFIMCRGKRLRERVLALLLVYSFFCVSIFPADAQAALRVTDMLSPRVNINIDNFYFDFRSKIILSEPGVTREFAQTLEQIKDHTAWQEDLEAIKRYYEASISEGVESNTNRMLWNLKKANDLCAKWIKAEEILRSSGFKSDSNFLKTISDYAQKIEAIKTGQTEECRKFWNIQRIDPKNGENVPAGYILKEDLSAIVPFLSPGLIWNDLEKLGLINENGKIDSNMLASVHNAGELKISAKEAEREKVLGELRDRMQGKPVSFRQAHEEGRWHANVQVLILDAEGNVLVEPRSDRGGVEIGGEIIQFGPIITTELAVTGHLKQGEDYPSAACRIIRDRLGISLSAEQLCRLPKLPYGQKKAGTSKYNQENIEYDEQGMHFLSRDAFNYEFAGAFIYILNDQQRAALKPKPDGRPKIEFMPLHSILEWHQNNEKIAAPFYRSAFMLTFNHPDNFNPILGETHGILIKILERANKDPENIDYDVDAIAKLAESVISLQRKLDDASVPKKDEDKPAQREAQAFRELKSLANSARVLYRWKKIKQLLASMDREHFHKLKETRMFFDEVKALGIGEKDKIARALIYLLAKKDVKLVVAEQGFVFQHNGIDLKGMRVDDNGKFQIINKRLIAGVKEIQRGAIASDMDLVLAMRDKNIDREILKFFNQLRLSGFVLAVISANEFRKQHGRSLAELIHENLLDDFYIYANGAGVKAKWDQGKIGTTTWGGEIKGSFVDDKDYGGTFSEQQLDFFDTRIHPVLKVWEKVIETIRANRTLLDEPSGHKELAVRITGALAGYRTDPEQNIAEALMPLADKIIADFHEILISGKNDEKFKAYQEAVKAQLDPRNTKAGLQEENKWPFLDRRWSLDDNDLLQITVKPIYPSNKYLSSDTPSGREIVGQIIFDLINESNARVSPVLSSEEDYAPLRMKEGGGTSIDIMREDIDKARAANDLIANLHLEDARDLLLAMDDEMARKGVGFPFMTIKDIFVLSMENTKGGVKRSYAPEENKEINADWLWSNECGLGVEIEATKNVFRLLLEKWESEMWDLVQGQNKVPVPAIRRLKEYLKMQAGDRYPAENLPITPVSDPVNLSSAIESAI